MPRTCQSASWAGRAGSRMCSCTILIRLLRVSAYPAITASLCDCCSLSRDANSFTTSASSTSPSCGSGNGSANHTNPKKQVARKARAPSENSPPMRKGEEGKAEKRRSIVDEPSANERGAIKWHTYLPTSEDKCADQVRERHGRCHRMAELNFRGDIF